MQLSIGKLAVILIALLIAVTLVTTGIGVFALQDNYRSMESRHEAEAHDTVRNAAVSIRNQIRFYQGILQLISSKPDVANLLEFGDDGEMTAWSQSMRRLLPGTLGAALANEHGHVHGDPLSQRVGPSCLSDMQQISIGAPINYPPLHDDVPGLEHFDLLTSIRSPDGASSGTVFVSFRLGIIEEQLQNMSIDGDVFQLLDNSGKARLTIGDEDSGAQAKSYRMRVPDSSWELVLNRPVPIDPSAFTLLVGADAVILVASGLLIVFLIRTTLSGFEKDMSRVHAALSDVIAGNYRPSDEPTAVRETGILLPDIEKLALRLQDQKKELRHQSLSDPLTGVFNRRYFDLMLAHLHEQSRRQQPALLVIIDLNDFKHVNDEFGHQAGDQVLQRIAGFLRAHVRATDIVARLGGDEFALILTNMSDNTVDDWLTALIHDYDHLQLEAGDNAVVFCHVSVGAAPIDANVYAGPADAFDAADRAMYSIKQRPKLRRSRYAVARITEEPTGALATEQR